MSPVHLGDSSLVPNAGVATVRIEAPVSPSNAHVVLATLMAFSPYHLTFDPENATTCVGPCTPIWPPLITTLKPVAEEEVSAQAIEILLSQAAETDAAVETGRSDTPPNSGHPHGTY